MRLGAARHFDRCANNASLHPPPAALRRCCPKQARYQLRYTPKYKVVKEMKAAAPPNGLLCSPSCGARNGYAPWSGAPFRPLRQQRLAASATGGASALLPKPRAANCATPRNVLSRSES
jgi:hypothetical protein